MPTLLSKENILVFLETWCKDVKTKSRMSLEDNFIKPKYQLLSSCVMYFGMKRFKQKLMFDIQANKMQK